MAWATTDDPRTEFVTVRLTKSEAADLDNHVRKLGFRSRSSAVRAAVDSAVSQQHPGLSTAPRGDGGGETDQ